MEKKEVDLTIIGGGITGLATAYIAAKNGSSVRVLEAEEKFGGLLQTFNKGFGDLEMFYHHFFTHDAEINWLIRELRIQDKLVLKSTSMGIYSPSGLEAFNGPMDVLRMKNLSFFSKLRFIFTTAHLSLIGNWKKSENISATVWLKKYCGIKAYKRIWAPLFNAKFSEFANEVPLSWLIGRLKQRLGSRKGGVEKLAYLNGSLKILLDTLLEKLKILGVELINNSAVTEVDYNGSLINSIKCSNRSFKSNQYLFTVPSTVLYNLFSNSDVLREAFKKHQYFGAACLILVMNKKLSPYYWINISDMNCSFSGIIEQTNFIDPLNYSGKHLVYLSRYFSKNSDISKMSEAELKDVFLTDLKLRFPNFSHDQLEDAILFKTSTAAPVVYKDYSSSVLDYQLPLKNAFVANMMHIYPDERSTNNSIRLGAELCKLMDKGGSEVPIGSSLTGII